MSFPKNHTVLANQCFKQILELTKTHSSEAAIFGMALKDILSHFSTELCRDEPIRFSNLFSQLSYLQKKYNSTALIHVLRRFPKVNKRIISDHPLDYILFLAEQLVSFIHQCTRCPIPIELEKHIQNKASIQTDPAFSWDNTRYLRVYVLKKTDVFTYLVQVDQDDQDQTIHIQLGHLSTQYGYAKLDYIQDGVVLQLIRPVMNAEGHYCPQHIILEPDYLIDVTAIAECMQDYAISPLLYLRKKLESIPNSRHIRLGNYANRVVDDLLSNQHQSSYTHLDILRNDFLANPIAYSSCFDLNKKERLKEYVEQTKMHFDTINQVINQRFESLEIHRKGISLEPAFISSNYGIQGRLDILFQDELGMIRIIELKSGSTPYPDDGKGIKPNHQAQLYLYYQLVADALDETSRNQSNIQGYILYSKSKTGPLRFDAPNHQRLGRIFDLRNQIVWLEKQLSTDQIESTHSLFKKLSDATFFAKKLNPRFKAIIEKQHQDIMLPILQASPLEKKYFYYFFQFIAVEQFTAKTGMGNPRGRSQSSLWLKTKAEKKKAFEILDQLQILDIQLNGDKQIIELKRTSTEHYVNFRVGDLCILYPQSVDHVLLDKTGNHPNSNQSIHFILKCHIQSISDQQVVVQLRHKQDFQSTFSKVKNWILELDHMDQSYIAQQRNLHQFLASKRSIKDQILCLKPPRKGQATSYSSPILSPQQQQIVNAAIAAPDYFLLNGPPGTGKTSIIIHHLLQFLTGEQEETILLLAFTNKAVDQLCNVLDRVFSDKHQFIRLGRPGSNDQTLYKQSLSYRIQEADQIARSNGKQLDRNALKVLFSKAKVIASTVSSISNKPDIFNLISFDRVIIDEASQLLEPQVVGVLSRVNRFIMIGDHKQLPAVVQQAREQSAITDKDLHEIGLYNRGDSLFQRLYQFCVHNELHHAYDQLIMQGRMHQEIAAFPSSYFYDNTLITMADYLQQDDHRQVIPLSYGTNCTTSQQKILSSNRLVFLPTQRIHFTPKSNIEEVQRVCRIIETVHQIHQNNNRPWHPEKLGVISPFRNQIALIRQSLLQTNVDGIEKIVVDTVERFQGDEKDIIIISFSVNTLHEVSLITAVDEWNGIDRKLNVTLTRAKEQIIMLGNMQLLNTNTNYKALMDHVRLNGMISNDFT